MKKFNYTLDPEEQELLDEIERGEWKSIPNVKEEIKKLQQAAAYTLELMEKEKEGEKTKITVRLSQMDVSELKKKATKMGTTYQSIIQSLIHKFLQRPDATA